VLRSNFSLGDCLTSGDIKPLPLLARLPLLPYETKGLPEVLGLSGDLKVIAAFFG